MNNDVIIIGAGICGLSLAKALSEQGKRVVILEARDRIGGRIETFRGKYSQTMEAGAEFVHGHLPLTQKLLKEAGIKLQEKEGEMYRSSEDVILEVKEFIPGMEELLQKMQALEEDCTLSVFLEDYFHDDKYEDLRKGAIRMAEGFDAADAEKISVKSLYEEWSGDRAQTALVIPQGYGSLIEYLAAKCISQGVVIELDKTVNQVKWAPGRVSINCEDGSEYNALKTVVTVPLGVLTSSPFEKAHIEFSPAIPEKMKAALQMGFGPVIKVLMEFQDFFWKQERFKNECAQINDLGFLMNNNAFPMLWVHDRLPGMTAWAGGSQAGRLKHFNAEELMQFAVLSLAEALNSTEDFIKEQLISCTVCNWALSPFSGGAYAYKTPESDASKKILSEPVEQTIYFAGEALGDTTGTVEAALESAQKLLKSDLLTLHSTYGAK